MFGSIGGSEFLLIAVLALLLFGPRKLPQIGRSVGRALAEFRGATQELRTNLEREVQMDNLKEAKDTFTRAGNEIAESVREVGLPSVARGTSERRDARDPDGSGPARRTVERPDDATRNDEPATPSGTSDGDPPAQT